MAYPSPVIAAELEPAMWRLYRDFFDQAEKKRRWSICDDIPWDQCNPNLNPAIADVVESFTAVELYLPDYTSKILPVVRLSKGRTWFYANWGYEESKHSLALGDWLLRLGMLIYAMVQEAATWLNYRNLRLKGENEGGDPALSKLLTLVAVDERAHHS